MRSVSDLMIDAKQGRCEEVLFFSLCAVRWMIGFTLILVAAGLWVQPGASWEADLALMKPGLSTVFLSLAWRLRHRVEPAVESSGGRVR